MAAIKALQQWCRIQCEGYRDVDIINMTTSFRDGMAFCALIHKHRPDIINYDSLRKENIYDNNKLAFTVAEEKLGIPALLDAEDMVALKVPDRLSILTYVSQYYNYFHGRSPIGGLAGVKRSAEESREEPSGKKSQPVIAKTFSPKAGVENRVPGASAASSTPGPAKVSPKPTRAPEEKKVLTDTSNKLGTLSSTCTVCKSHVHLVQRHLVDGKLYHRNCFRCKECSTILLSGTYKAGPEPGTFICCTHQDPVHGKAPCTATPQKGPGFNKVASPWSGGNNQGTPTSQTAAENPTSCSTTPTAKAWTPSTEKTQAAREKFFQSTPSPPKNTSHWLTPCTENAGKSTPPTSMAWGGDKGGSPMSKEPTEGNSNNNNRLYPSGLKPTDNRSTNISAVTPSWKKDQNNAGKTGLKHVEASPQTKGDTANKTSPWSKLAKPESPRPSTVSSNSKAESPSDWRSKLKPVSKGPKAMDPGKPSFTTDAKKPNPPSEASPSRPGNTGSSQPVLNPVITPPIQPYNPKAAPPQPSSSGPGSWGFKNGKGSSDTNTFKPEIHAPKNKPDYIPKEEILKELEEIEKNLNDLEKQGVELEKRLRRSEEQEEEDILMDDLMVDWFKLIRSKQVYMRRESELVYIAKTQDLEEQQPGVEGELRRLMEKPEHLKTEADRQKEKVLMEKLVEIVNDRNAIVEGLDEDRLREEEEDEQLNLMMKNLDIQKGKNKKKSPIPKFLRRKSKDSGEA